MRSVEECFRGSRVRVFRLDREGVRARLAEGARALLAERPEVLEVRLFGSLGRGDARPGSDADLLLLLSTCPLPFVERAPLFFPYFSGAGIGCDVFAYTRAEIDTLRKQGSLLVRAADTEGVVSARRQEGPDEPN